MGSAPPLRLLHTAVPTLCERSKTIPRRKRKAKASSQIPGYSACKLSLSPWALCQRQCQSCKRGALHLVYIILTLITVVIPRSVGGYHASLSRSRPGFESQRGNLFSSIPRETRRVSRHEHNFFLPLQMSTPRIDHRLACVCSCWCPSGEVWGLLDNKTHTCARAHTLLTTDPLLSLI